MIHPKLVITDIDGVWTDGGMYYDQQGNEWKKFNTSDSAGVLFLRLAEIPLVIMTGEDTEIVKRRADKLRIEQVYQGVKDKLKVATDLTAQMGIRLEDVAFIGDDLGDMPLLRKVGFAACPNNAPHYVKSLVHLVTQKSGGEGAFREFVEHMLSQSDRLNPILAQHEQSLHCS